MGIFHKFLSAVADSADTTIVRPTNWNDDHNSPAFIVPFSATSAATQAWTNMPAALTEFAGLTRYRVPFDLTFATQARIATLLTVVGISTAELRVQYSKDSGTTWNYLDGASGPLVTLGTTSNTPRVGPWVNLVADAKADVWLRVVGINGDGVADPTFAYVVMHLR